MGEPLVIVGNGMVAARLVERLTDRALGRYDIAVIGAEPHPAYNRVLLSSLLAGDVEEGDLTLKPSLWWRRKGVTTVFGRSVDTVDTAGHTVSLSDGTILPFAKLVFTTGSQPIRLPKPGMDLPGVITFRDLTDIATLRALGDNGGKGGGAAAVIGGGLLGIEAAYGLARAGVRVTLIHLMDRLMERQLDAPAAALLRRAIESRGVEVVLCADTARVIGEGRAEGLELTDGRVIPADLVVCAVGIRANAALAKSAGVHVNRGIVVDDGLATSLPGIYAAGECAEHRGVCYGLVEPGYEQANVLAARLAGDANATYPGSVLATNLKVSGVSVFSAGDFSGGPGVHDLVFTDEAAGLYRRLLISDGRLTGAVLFGDTTDALWYLDLIRTGADIRGMRDRLIFGRAIASPRQAA